MAGTLTFLGEVTIGGVLVSAGALYAKMVADLQTQLDAAILLQARLTLHPPTLSAQIDIVVKLLANLRAALVLGLPGVDFQLSACATAIAALRARLSFLLGLPLGVAGVMAYVYDGTANSFGPTVGTTVGQGLPGGRADDHVNALVFVTSIPGTWAALGEVFIK